MAAVIAPKRDEWRHSRWRAGPRCQPAKGGRRIPNAPNQVTADMAHPAGQWPGRCRFWTRETCSSVAPVDIRPSDEYRGVTVREKCAPWGVSPSAIRPDRLVVTISEYAQPLRSRSHGCCDGPDSVSN